MLLLTLISSLLFLFGVNATIFRWPSGPENGGFLGVPHGGCCTNAQNGTQVYATGPFSRYVNRYITFGWNIEGEHIVMAGHGNLCLDAGWDAGYGSTLKVWKCFDNHPPQRFKYENERIIHIPTGFCVDVKDGDRQNLQLWKCFDGNTNQRWVPYKLQSAVIAAAGTEVDPVQ